MPPPPVQYRVRPDPVQNRVKPIKYLENCHCGTIDKALNWKLCSPNLYIKGLPRGWTWNIYGQGSAEYFLGFEFRKSVFFWYWSKQLYLFGLSKKMLNLKCLLSSMVFFSPNPIYQVLQQTHLFIIIIP